MADERKTQLFEQTAVPRAVMILSVPTVLSCLVSIFYSLADTYFVGMLNDPVQTAAVTLAAPVLLAFNAVNNLFGVGGSSMMSRALGRGDMKTLRASSAFGFWGALVCGVLYSLACFAGMQPLLSLLGANAVTAGPTQDYMFYTVLLGATPSILNVVMAYLIRSEGATLHASVGDVSFDGLPSRAGSTYLSTETGDVSATLFCEDRSVSYSLNTDVGTVTVDGVDCGSSASYSVGSVAWHFNAWTNVGDVSLAFDPEGVVGVIQGEDNGGIYTIVPTSPPVSVTD